MTHFEQYRHTSTSGFGGGALLTGDFLSHGAVSHVTSNIKTMPGVQIIDSDVEGPAFFDRNALVAKSTVGRYCSLGADSSALRCTIGSFCAIGARVAINPFNHPTDWFSTHEFQYRADSYDWVAEYRDMARLERTPDMFSKVTIGNDVWIGHGAVIVGDINVGDGVVIGANAVVTENVPPYAIVVGAPARIVRFRFDPTTIARLMRVKWWELPLEKLSGLPFRDVYWCLNALETQRGFHGPVPTLPEPRNQGPDRKE